MEFDWDESNEEHVARHGVSRTEAEEALADPLGFELSVADKSGELRYRHAGSTTRGRLLVIAYTMRAEAIRPITAYDADSFTARSYRNGPRR